MTHEQPILTEIPLELPGPTVKRGAWTLGFCPAHADGTKHGRRAGQSLGLSAKGVLMCFAGCDQRDVRRLLVIVAPHPQAPVYRPSTYRASATASEEPIIAWYDYLDDLGVLRFIVGRTPSKQFPVFHLENGRWRAGYGGKRILYRLPELLAADPVELVLITEGEKDCDRARREGFIAVTVPGGANSGRVCDLEPLRGREVVLVPDKDLAGGKLAAVLMQRLRAFGK